MAIKVTLRQKPISGNRKSLYLDFYPPIPHPKTGEPTRRKFLGLYIFEKSKHPLDLQHNKEQLQLAEQIRRTNEKELNQNEALSNIEKNFIDREQRAKIQEAKELLKGEQNFVAYFKNLADKRKSSNFDNWNSAYNYLNKFTNGNLRLADLNVKFCNEFKEFLLNTTSFKSDDLKLSQNSAVSYFNKLKAALKQAYKDDLLSTDLNSKIEAIKQVDTHRNFLTIAELNELIKTDCNNSTLKKAALFSALTGLRFIDIQNLFWADIEYIEGNGYFLKFTQQKTKSTEMMPISEQAFNLLGASQNPTDKVFKGLKYSAYENKHLKDWIIKAKITKEITFHCFRHTFATLQLLEGTDIYTVSKMLGHKELKTTQIYAKVIDKTKRDAANKIKLNF